jgi:hypothetical protein
MKKIENKSSIKIENNINYKTINISNTNINTKHIKSENKSIQKNKEDDIFKNNLKLKKNLSNNEDKYKNKNIEREDKEKINNNNKILNRNQTQKTITNFTHSHYTNININTANVSFNKSDFLIINNEKEKGIKKTITEDLILKTKIFLKDKNDNKKINNEENQKENINLNSSININNNISIKKLEKPKLKFFKKIFNLTKIIENIGRYSF